MAWFRLLDQVRADSAEAVRYLAHLGVAVHLLTGDALDTAEAVARELGITSVASEVSPEAKLAFVQNLLSGQPEVMMVGDGVNDIAALSIATTSVTMADASDFVQAKTDAVLLSNRVVDIARAIEFARKTRHIIGQNLTWALAYNLVALPLAIGGLVAPWFAALGMSLSSLLVVGNAWRLRNLNG
jgi:Cu2+-exporting ATPase